MSAPLYLSLTLTDLLIIHNHQLIHNQPLIHAQFINDRLTDRPGTYFI